MIGSAVCGLLLLLVCFLLYREIDHLRDVKKKVTAKRKDLDTYFERDPFPSPTNVAAFRQNCGDLDNEMGLLIKHMGSGQLQMKAEQEPLEWLTMLTRMQKDLIDRANAKGVSLASTSFGFGKYGEGTPPSRADVRRLTLQVKLVDAVCQQLYDAGIRELLSVDREIFEGESADAVMVTGEEQATSASTNAIETLFSVEPLTLRFKAKEMALVNVLNSFASSKLLIVVTGVTIQGGQGVQIEESMAAAGAASSVIASGPVSSENTVVAEETAAPAAAAPVSEIDTRPREERVVSGRSKEVQANITVTIKIYRFVAGDMSAQAAAPAAQPAP